MPFGTRTALELGRANAAEAAGGRVSSTLAAAVVLAVIGCAPPRAPASAAAPLPLPAGVVASVWALTVERVRREAVTTWLRGLGISAERQHQNQVPLATEIMRNLLRARSPGRMLRHWQARERVPDASAAVDSAAPPRGSARRQLAKRY